MDFLLSIKIGLPWCEITKNKVAKITCTYFEDKSQKFAPTEKKLIYIKKQIDTEDNFKIQMRFYKQKWQRILECCHQDYLNNKYGFIFT